MAWQESADDRGTDVEDSSKIAPYALYAFDAAWTFIQALAALEPDDELPSMTNRSCCFGSRLENRQAYFRNLKKTHFWGVSGAVGFPLNDSNDRVDDIAYALYCLERIHSGYDKNVPAWSYDDVMIWNTISPSWRDSTNKSANQSDWRCSFSNKIPSDDLRLQGKSLTMLCIEMLSYSIS